MATKRLQAMPIGPARVALNRADPKDGEGPFVKLVSGTDAELVTPNGLCWNGTRMSRVFSEPSTNPYPKNDTRWQGNRADMVALGGNKTVNYPAPDGTRHGGNDSGE